MSGYNEGMLIYEPTNLVEPIRVLELPENVPPSAWKGMERILLDILDRFNVGRELALEFGVECGYSAVALSNYFKKVIGVDHFIGDIHTGKHESWYEATRDRLAPYKNIQLVNSSWETFARDNDEQYDLIHVDVEHTFEMTMDVGHWACKHSRFSIWHDTMSFPQVSWALAKLAECYGFQYWNYTRDCGLGILVKQ